MAALVGVGVLQAGTVIVQAWLLAQVVADLVGGGPLTDHTRGLALLGLSFVVRGALAAVQQWAASRASARVKSQLRAELVRARLDRPFDTSTSGGAFNTLVTRGVDALDGWFAGYLPQLVLAVVVPVMVGLAIGWADPTSLVVVVLTLPLIPVFMVLVGLVTRDRLDAGWRAQARLGHHFADLVAGLPTLQVLGRARAQVEGLRRVEARHEAATLQTLRVAFLSALVLELLATLSVALVAVGIGLRVVDGEMPLVLGLMVLVLAPEVYLPLRQVGSRYHDAVDGMAAAEQAFSLLDGDPEQGAPEEVAGSRPAWPDVAGADRFEVLSVEGVSLARGDRTVVEGLDLVLRPGEVVAVAGPSGVGKSTLMTALLGHLAPTAGRIALDGVDLTALDRDRWRRLVAWVGQDADLWPSTVGENVAMGAPGAPVGRVRRALDLADATDLPVDAVVAPDGTGLSAGERRRVALARALLAIDCGGARLLLLDEPTAGLDVDTEAGVVRSLRSLGVAVLVVSHRIPVLAAADRVLHLTHPSTPSTTDSADTPTTPPVPGTATTPDANAGAPVPDPAATPDADAYADVTVPDARASTTVGTAGAAATLGTATTVPAAPATSRSSLTLTDPAATTPDRATALATSPADGGGADGEPRVTTGPGAFQPVPEGGAPGTVSGSGGRWENSSEERGGGSTGRDTVPGAPPVPHLPTKRLTAGATALAVGAATAGVALMATSAWLLARASEQPPVLYLMVAVTGVRFFGLSRGVLRYLDRLASHRLGLRHQAAARLRSYTGLAGSDLLGRRLGDLVSRLVLDTESAQDRVVRVRLPLLAAWTVGGLAVVGFGLLVPAAGAVLAVHLLLAGLVWPVLAARVSARDDARVARLRGWLAEQVLLVHRHAALLHTTRHEREPLAEVRSRDAAVRRTEERAARARGLGQLAAFATLGVTEVALLVVGARAVAAGELAPIVLAVLALTPLALHELLLPLSDTLQTRMRVRAALARVDEVAATPPLRVPEVPALGRPGLRLERLLVGRDRPLLDPLDLDVAPGARIVVVGPSGVGKSTLVATLLGRLAPLGGELAVGGPVGCLTQDAHLFDTTVAENVRLGRPDASAEEVRQVLAAVGLDLDPARMVGEHGARISGGEARRVALARLLLARPATVILDEPTEHLDADTARALLCDVDAIWSQAPVVAVSHQPEVFLEAWGDTVQVVTAVPVGSSWTSVGTS
nr:thiol reductant ABC exporter subunit CydD [Auraticoccus monumenti]